MKMDDLLKVNFLEKSSNVTVTVKKTVQTKQYEPLTIEVSSEYCFDGNSSGIEKAVVHNTVIATLEYTILCHLYKKGLISQEEFIREKSKIELSHEAIATKCEKLTGKDIKSFLFKNGETE